MAEGDKVRVINCPKCGGQLEVLLGAETCVCKYCKSTVKVPVSKVDFKLVKNEKIEVTVDGKTTEYGSIEEMPPELSQRFRQMTGKDRTHIEERDGEYTINGVHYGPIEKVPEEYRQKIINIKAGLSPSGKPANPDMVVKHSRTVVKPNSGGPEFKFIFAAGISASDMPDSLYRYVLGRYGHICKDPEAERKVIAFCLKCQGETEYRKTFFGTKRCVKCKAQVIILDIKNGTVWVHW